MMRRVVLCSMVLLGVFLALAPSAGAQTSLALPPDDEHSFIGSFFLGSDIAFLYWPTAASDPDMHIMIVAASSGFFHTLGNIGVSRGGPVVGPITGATFFFDFIDVVGGGLIRFRVWSCAFPQTSDGTCFPGEYDNLGLFLF